MKKTLVALAVLAASGASFAQVTITGNLNYGYRASKVGGIDAAGNKLSGSDKSGLGVRDSNITFGFSEDLGAGLKASGQMKIDALNRGGVAGGDAFISLSNGMGFLTMGNQEVDSDLNSISSNVADGGLDGALAGSYSAVTTGAASGYYNNSDLLHDYLTVGSTFGPVVVSLTHYEPANVLGLGVGAAGSTGQRENLIKGVYAAGPVTAELSYGSFDNKNDTVPLWFSMDHVTTLAGNYNFGVASVGAGYQKTTYSNGSAQETLLSVSVPLGALTLSALMDSAKIDSAGFVPGVDGTANGYAVAASYALSKRTAIRARYYSYDAIVNPTERDTLTEVVLKHSF